MKKKNIYLCLCVFWMIAIFWFSHQQADDSQGMSDGIIKMIDSLFHINIVESGGWVFDTFSFIVRKSAHMSEYALLAILFALFFKASGYEKYYVIAFVCVILYASSDEIHQLFVRGRSGQIVDVVIDSIGGLLGLWGQQIYFWIVMKRKKVDKKIADS
ncbi:MAG: VanZ family protein [Longicatena sp.]